jgi:hypothetical protein
MPIIVTRGGTQLGLDELKAHLATLLRLENVGVLLGAGASVTAGGHTVQFLWSQFVQAYPGSAQTLLQWNFVGASDVNADPAQRTTPNIERLGDTLEIASLEWRRMGTAAAQLTTLLAAIKDIKRAVVRAAMLQMDWWTNPESVRIAPQLASHKSLLQKVSSARQPGQPSPWFFTTNYDLAVEWSAEAIELQVLNGFQGIHHRRFSPQSFDVGLRNTQARGEARFGVHNVYLAKLHGSLTWSENDGELYEHAAYSSYAGLNTYLNGGDEPVKTMVFPRAAKYVETVGFILGELLRRYSEFLVRPQTALFITGYGFGDEHLNRILLSALQNPTLQLVVYLPELDLENIGSNSRTVQNLLNLRSPNVTLVGGGNEAYFDSFVGHLPDPIVFDEQAQRIRDILRSQRPGGDLA